jgi:DNA repair exonuclease SbcCD ATPase subunit
MKKVFVLSMLVSLAIVCSCQKKDSAAQQQLAQRTTELGAREEELAEKLNSLDEKMNSLDQRVKELAEKDETAANARTNPTDVQGQTLDPAQLQAEKERLIQQLSTMGPKPPELNAAEKQRQLEAAEGVPPPPQ